MECEPEVQRVCVAVANGDVESLRKLLNDDSNLWQRALESDRTLLHIAAKEGHLAVAAELVERCPEMHSWPDSLGQSAIQVAALNGRSAVIELLVERNKGSAMTKHYKDDDNLMHLCVRGRHVGACQIVLRLLKDELVAQHNGDGDTPLHLAVRLGAYEMFRCMLDNGVDPRVLNSKGQSPLEFVRTLPECQSTVMMEHELMMLISQAKRRRRPGTAPEDETWLAGKRETLIVVAALIATMAFQAAVSPPGGVLQQDVPEWKRTAGEAVMGYNHPTKFTVFMTANTTAFATSITVLAILISGVPIKRRFFVRALQGTMVSMSLFGVAAAYVISALVIAPAGINAASINFVSLALFIFSCWFIAFTNAYCYYVQPSKQQLTGQSTLI